jgi:PiT family inorganic phosphate transporter
VVAWPALVGGLVGAALAEGGTAAVNWGGFDGWRPVGVIGTLVALAISPVIGFVAAFVVLRSLKRLLRRASSRMRAPVNSAQWVGSAALAFSHGSNDAQKAVGLVAALLLASGETQTLSAPLWVTVGSAAALTVGTAFGGWRIVKTIGRRIYRIRPLDGCSNHVRWAIVREMGIAWLTTIPATAVIAAVAFMIWRWAA